MVYLNGDWNLDLSPWLIAGGAFDVPYGAWVGTTEVEAWADYPYFRKHGVITSNSVLKDWWWGKNILGPDPWTYNDGSMDPIGNRMVLNVGIFTPEPFPDEMTGTSDTKMVFIWVSDRDGQKVVGEKIEWYIGGPALSAVIPGATGCGVSIFNAVTMSICTDNGFLRGTGGVVLDAPANSVGRSWTIGQSDWQSDGMLLDELFTKFWDPLLTGSPDPADYGVAAILVQLNDFDDHVLTVWLYEEEGVITRRFNLDQTFADPLDDPVLLGDANMDGTIDMGDVISAERMILGLRGSTTNADANWDRDIDMGDVIRIERLVLGK
jgi:hypothetical protein